MEDLGDVLHGCPFCGSPAVSVVDVARDGIANLLAVECNSCNARGPVVDSNHARQALERWNRRTHRGGTNGI